MQRFDHPCWQLRASPGTSSLANVPVERPTCDLHLPTMAVSRTVLASVPCACFGSHESGANTSGHLRGYAVREFTSAAPVPVAAFHEASSSHLEKRSFDEPCEFSSEQPALMFDETPEDHGSQPFKCTQLAAPLTSVLPEGCLGFGDTANDIPGAQVDFPSGGCGQGHPRAANCCAM